MNRPHPARMLLALALVALATAPGCARFGRDPAPAPHPTGLVSGQSAGGQRLDHLTSQRLGDRERALRMGREILRKEGLDDKYDITTATAYERGAQWEVCFTPKRGPFKRLRKRCFLFSF